MKLNKKLIIVMSIILALAILLTGYVIWFNKDADKRTAEVVAIADQFKAPADWRLIDDQINRPTLTGCIDIVCPSVHKNWDFDPKSPSEVDKILDSLAGLGWVFSEKLGCGVKDISEEKSSICYLRGNSNGENITFSVHVENRSLTGATLHIE